jgi:superfamily II RNA helicase
MLPKHIQMIMLSATLDNPSNFARWIETRGENNDVETEQKQVYLATSNYRHVPLTHYMYVSSPQTIFKAERDKTVQQKIRDTLDTLHPVVSATGTFDEVTYNRVNDTLKLLEKHKVFVKRSFVLNEICKYMVHNNMLPAVCFILSKKQIQVASREISVPLLSEDDAVPAVVAHECDQLLRSKLPNHEEFKRLPEYIEMVELMSKGIAVHHSGVLPILREMVELMFARGFIKLLFATETFSVGIDMPIKTALFTDIKKFDGSGRRMFLPHEYIQAAGRAGRRGRDTVGHVIHLPNLYRDMSRLEFRAMATGGPQSLVSKFRISYGLVLNLLGANSEANTEGVSRSTSFCGRSMIQYELDKQVTGLNQQIAAAQQEIIKKEECIKHLRTPLDTIYRFHELEKEIPSSKNKKRKILERELATIKENRNIMSDAATVKSLKDKQSEVQELNNQLVAASTYLGNQVGSIIDLFKRDDYISSSGTLTLKGNYAANIREAHSLVFAEMLTSPEFASLEACDLTVLLSCFAGLRVAEDDRDQYVSPDEPADLKAVLKIAAETAAACADFENEEQLYTSRGDDSDIQFDLMSLVREWYESEDEPACKLVVQRAQQEKGILLGEFTKAITKIVNIAAEVERVAEFAGDLAMVVRLRDVSKNLLKFVVTNQSLYV